MLAIIVVESFRSTTRRVRAPFARQVFDRCQHAVQHAGSTESKVDTVETWNFFTRERMLAIIVEHRIP